MLFSFLFSVGEEYRQEAKFLFYFILYQSKSQVFFEPMQRHLSNPLWLSSLNYIEVSRTAGEILTVLNLLSQNGHNSVVYFSIAVKLFGIPTSGQKLFFPPIHENPTPLLI